MADASCVELRDVVIVGGGCYGTFYLRQLLAARERGRAAWRALLVVDQDAGCQAAGIADEPGVRFVVAEWGTFFDRFLADGDRANGDRIVPSPLMPHLLLEWLVRRSAARYPNRALTVGGGAPLGTVFESIGADGTRYVSHADWICPVHCVEPLVCPATRAPRTWDMSETVRGAAPTPGDAALFACHHAVFGVGMIDIAPVLDADRRLAEAGVHGAATEMLVGTVSRCHGAVTRLALAGSDSRVVRDSVGTVTSEPPSS